MNKTTIVTAVYYSKYDSSMGGRGWDFSYYRPTLYAMSVLDVERVVIYHDTHSQTHLETFIQENNLTNFELKLVEISELPNYETIKTINEKRIEPHLHDGEFLALNNNRLYIVCLSKPWFLKKTISEYNIIDNPVVWIDAGLFKHSLFPESAGGVELARFDKQNYYPENKTSKLNPEFGKKMDELLRQDNKIYGYGNQQNTLPIPWESDVAPTLVQMHFVGGFFGGMPDAINNLYNKFNEILTKVLSHSILTLEEPILSVLHNMEIDSFYVNTFETWYHDVPTDPCYFGAFQNQYSFYRSFFNLIFEKESRFKKMVPVEPYRAILENIDSKIPYPSPYDLPNIAIYGSHNASVAVEKNGQILEVLEIERLLNVKNSGFAQYNVSHGRHFLINLILKYFEDKYGFKEYGYCLHQHCETIEGHGLVLYWKQIPAKKYIECKHHISHASGVFYQSPFDKAIVISFDGGGNDGYFKIFYAERKDNLRLLADYRLDLGFPYMVFGEFLSDIKFEPSLSTGNLVYAGKILGLQSYGNVVKEWLPHFKDFYLSQPVGNDYHSKLSELGEKIGVVFDSTNRLSGEIQYNVASTSQAAFEELFFELTDEFIKKYPNTPICVAGGCALNIVLNTKLKQRHNTEIFVGPNPNDCGLSVGMLAHLIRPETPIDVTYSGPELLDKHLLPRYIENSHRTELLDAAGLAKKIFDGSIVGLVQGRSEHGPRALGNRSIICNPLISDMKDKLNKNVKNREWYRPFAPVVRLEDVSKYFDWEGESRWMSFCPMVKEEYRDIMPAIVHIDNTARVQTVTREQNQFIYDLLTEFEKLSGVGVLLNTSFNVDGKPILSTLEDAFTVLRKTQLDALYIEGHYFV